MSERDVLIVNPLGLHARPAAQIVRTANDFASDIRLEKDGMEVNGKSIMGVMMLAAGMGTEITLETSGEREQEAMDALMTLIHDRFGEGE